MQAYDEALRLFADSALTEQWQNHLSGVADDPQVPATIAGLSLRRPNKFGTWASVDIAWPFSRHVIGDRPKLTATAKPDQDQHAKIKP
jgi:hypothetical protein